MSKTPVMLISIFTLLCALSCGQAKKIDNRSHRSIPYHSRPDTKIWACVDNDISIDIAFLVDATLSGPCAQKSIRQTQTLIKTLAKYNKSGIFHLAAVGFHQSATLLSGFDEKKVTSEMARKLEELIEQGKNQVKNLLSALDLTNREFGKRPGPQKRFVLIFTDDKSVANFDKTITFAETLKNSGNKIYIVSSKVPIQHFLKIADKNHQYLESCDVFLKNGVKYAINHLCMQIMGLTLASTLSDEDTGKKTTPNADTPGKLFKGWRLWVVIGVGVFVVLIIIAVFLLLLASGKGRKGTTESRKSTSGHNLAAGKVKSLENVRSPGSEPEAEKEKIPMVKRTLSFLVPLQAKDVTWGSLSKSGTAGGKGPKGLHKRESKAKLDRKHAEGGKRTPKAHTKP